MINKFWEKFVENMIRDNTIEKITTAEIQDKIQFYWIAVHEQLIRIGENNKLDDNKKV
jgi:hypothetical protein